MIKYCHLMALTSPTIRLDQAQISHGANGAVIIDDPESPLIVTAIIDTVSSPRRITELTVRVRHPSGRISPATLTRLPLTRIRRLAIGGDEHPNDLMWRARIKERDVGKREWDEEHWRLVWEVDQWARQTRRKGGGLQAIADMWDVSKNPTASRWRKRATNLHADTTATSHLGE